MWGAACERKRKNTKRPKSHRTKSTPHRKPAHPLSVKPARAKPKLADQKIQRVQGINEDQPKRLRLGRNFAGGTGCQRGRGIGKGQLGEKNQPADIAQQREPCNRRMGKEFPKIARGVSTVHKKRLSDRSTGGDASRHLGSGKGRKKITKMVPGREDD